MLQRLSPGWSNTSFPSSLYKNGETAKMNGNGVLSSTDMRVLSSSSWWDVERKSSAERKVSVLTCRGGTILAIRSGDLVLQLP